LRKSWLDDYYGIRCNERERNFHYNCLSHCCLINLNAHCQISSSLAHWRFCSRGYLNSFMHILIFVSSSRWKWCKRKENFYFLVNHHREFLTSTTELTNKFMLYAL
jgi:hypothetical protein